MAGRNSGWTVEVDSSGLRWFKSSASSSGNTVNCVEIAWAGAVVLVRNSRDRAGARLAIPTASWAAFVAR
ncbi:MAG TPA: DUF397 domain-containing protein [Pseudonocardiaceae bacterium]|nr:DUF397 domain-containing protein [Pseudonocardiaceae bacterium]